MAVSNNWSQEPYYLGVYIRTPGFRNSHMRVIDSCTKPQVWTATKDADGICRKVAVELGDMTSLPTPFKQDSQVYVYDLLLALESHSNTYFRPTWCPGVWLGANGFGWNECFSQDLPSSASAPLPPLFLLLPALSASDIFSCPLVWSPSSAPGYMLTRGSWILSQARLRKPD